MNEKILYYWLEDDINITYIFWLFIIEVIFYIIFHVIFLMIQLLIGCCIYLLKILLKIRENRFYLLF